MEHKEEMDSRRTSIDCVMAMLLISSVISSGSSTLRKEEEEEEENEESAAAVLWSCWSFVLEAAEKRGDTAQVKLKLEHAAGIGQRALPLLLRQPLPRLNVRHQLRRKGKNKTKQKQNKTKQ